MSTFLWILLGIQLLYVIYNGMKTDESVDIAADVGRFIAIMFKLACWCFLLGLAMLGFYYPLFFIVVLLFGIFSLLLKGAKV